MKVIIGEYEGTIYQEEQGFTGAISLGFGPDGKRRRLKRKGRTKAEVKAKLAKAVDDLQKGVRVDRNYRVKDAVNDYLDELARQGRAKNTLNTYRSLVDHQIIPFIGYAKVADLTSDQVSKWLDERSAYLTKSTLRRAHLLLKQGMRRAARHDKVARNVAALVDTPRGKAGRRSRSLTLEQAAALMAEAAKPKYRLGAYVILAIVSGLRTEELRALRWSDVDLKSATVYVLRADRHEGETKTPLSRRGLGVADVAVEALGALRKRQAAEKLSAGEAYQDHDLVFCHEDGSPYTPQAVHRRFRKITAAAGIGTDWNPRELRHTFVSIMSDHGVPTQQISDLVGHKNTQITETVYRHQLKPVVRHGAEHMNQIFASKINKSA